MKCSKCGLEAPQGRPFCDACVTDPAEGPAGQAPAAAPAPVARDVGVLPLQPVPEPQRGLGVGLFAGVNEFSHDPCLNFLRFAVNDAIDLAFAFIHALRLLDPAKTCLALSGRPTDEPRDRKLQDLRDSGVTVVPADRTTLLRRLRHACGEPGPLLVVAASTHGFRDHLVPADGDHLLLEDTGIAKSRLEEFLRSSPAPRRLVFLDACRNEPLRSEGAKAAGSVAPAELLSQKLAEHEGRAVLRSCDDGQVSYEFEELGNGLAAHYFLRALGVKPKPDADPFDGPLSPSTDGLVTLGAVSQYITGGAEAFLAHHRRDLPRPLRPKPTLDAAEQLRQMPLALDPGTGEAIARWRQEVEALLKRLQLLVDFDGGAFSPAAFRSLRDGLRQSYPSDRDARALVTNARAFAEGHVTDEALVAYLTSRLTRTPAASAPAASAEPPAPATPATPARPSPQLEMRIDGPWRLVSSRELGKAKWAYNFSADEQLLLAAGSTMLCLWNMQDRRPLWRRYTASYIHSAAVSGDGRLVAASEVNQVVVLSCDTGAAVRTYPCEHVVMVPPVFSPDRRYLVIAGLGADVRVLDLGSSGAGRTIADTEGTFVNRMRFSRDGRRLILIGYPGANVVDTSSWRELRAFKTGAGARQVYAVHPDASVVLAPRGDFLEPWVSEVDTGRPICKLDGKRIRIRKAAFNPVAPQLATGSSDGRIEVWDTRSGCLVTSLPGHADEIRCLEYGSNGRLLLSAASRDGITRVWDAATGEQLRQVTTGLDFQNARFSPKGTWAIVGGTGRGEVAFATDDQQADQDLSWTDLPAPVWEVVFTEDGARMAVQFDGGEVLADLDGKDTGEPVPEGTFAAPATDHGRRLRAVAGPGNTLVVTDRATGAQVASIGPIEPWVRSPRFCGQGDRTRLAAVCGGKVRCWSAETRAEVPAGIERNENIRSLFTDLDPSHLYALTDDGAVRRWDLSTGRVSLELPPKDQLNRSAALSTDERYLATTTDGGEVIVWDTAGGKEVSRFKPEGVARCAAFYPEDCRRLIVGTVSGGVQIWSQR